MRGILLHGASGIADLGRAVSDQTSVSSGPTNAACLDPDQVSERSKTRAGLYVFCIASTFGGDFGAKDRSIGVQLLKTATTICSHQLRDVEAEQ
jgi:hypothetical protein